MTQTNKYGRRGRQLRSGSSGAVAKTLDPKFFKALCDPNRISLLLRLAGCGRACTVSELNSCCPIDLSVVSRHLGVLRDAGIIESEKRGKQVYYTVCAVEVIATLRSIANALEGCCCEPKSRQEKKK
jgi:DNA-binding transcriptional ArsR family regulator